RVWRLRSMLHRAQRLHITRWLAEALPSALAFLNASRRPVRNWALFGTPFRTIHISRLRWRKPLPSLPGRLRRYRRVSAIRFHDVRRRLVETAAGGGVA